MDGEDQPEAENEKGTNLVFGQIASNGVAEHAQSCSLSSLLHLHIDSYHMAGEMSRLQHSPVFPVECLLPQSPPR